MRIVFSGCSAEVIPIIRTLRLLLFTTAIALMQGCGPGNDTGENEDSRIGIELMAQANDLELNEISGIETLDGPHFIVHNDDGGPDLWILDGKGDTARKFRIKGAKNGDWEDLTRIEHDGKSLLAVGAIGDNLGRRDSIQIYFITVPAPDAKADTVEAVHALELTYPDGARDCESLAFDSSSNSLLFLTKRDRPPRLYRAGIDEALQKSQLELEFVGTVPTFRPPGPDDIRVFGNVSSFVSQPTGMDINAAGNLAAVITYRSLYLYARSPRETWIQAFQKKPREFHGPRSTAEEAVAFGPDMDVLYVSAEGHPAPIFRVELPQPSAARQ